jgi:hypothetical protein
MAVLILGSYDDRINDICDYKEKLLQKKGGTSLYRPLAKISDSMDNKSTMRMMLKHNKSISKSISKSRLTDSHTSSSENILIMSVLKKL